MIKLKFFGFLHLFFAIKAQSIPELCSNSNKGDCNCGFGDVKTYVFTPGDYTRCIHTFIPETQSDSLPVLISVSAYGQGTIFPGSQAVAKARYHGYALFGIGSTGPFDGAGNFGLEFPANGVVNHLNPTPCSDSDSRDYNYIKGVLDFIANHDGLDASKVYFEGFSQNSMFAAYASVCFADRVAGLWQGGSGLAKTFYLPLVPGLQGQCSASDFATHGNDCCNDNFCSDCTWWPLYPKTCENKLIDCIATYTNDNIACGSDYYMYESMIEEGNDARMLSFTPNAPSAPGGHKNPENMYSWVVGCLGIVDSCSTACETNFLSCITTSSVDEYTRCEIELESGNIANCEVGCAPTLEMLKTSESPLINLSEGKFGTQSGLTVTSTPDRPDCDVAFGSFYDVGYHNRCRPPSGIGPSEGDIESCDGVKETPEPSTPTIRTPSPSSAPSPENIPEDCVDFGGRIRFDNNSGSKITRSCEWAGNKSTDRRCLYSGVSEACPFSCGTCSICSDPPSGLRFKFSKDGAMITRTCDWVKRKETPSRCELTDNICRATCGVCEIR